MKHCAHTHTHTQTEASPTLRDLVEWGLALRSAGIVFGDPRPAALEEITRKMTHI